MNFALISTCFVLGEKLLRATDIAPLLSQNYFMHRLLSVENSASMRLSQTDVSDMNSASVDDNATVFCFLVPHESAQFWYKKTPSSWMPVVDISCPISVAVASILVICLLSINDSKTLRAFQISHNSFGCLPMCFAGIYSKMTQYVYRVCNIWSWYLRRKE